MKRNRRNVSSDFTAVSDGYAKPHRQTLFQGEEKRKIKLILIFI